MNIWDVATGNCKWCDDLKLPKCIQWIIKIICQLVLLALYSAVFAAAGSGTIYIIWMRIVQIMN